MRIAAAKVVTPLQLIENGVIELSERGLIGGVGSAGGASTQDAQLSFPNHTVVPGLIDIHTHGGIGHTFGQGDDLAERLCAYSAWVASTGVTGFLCTLSAPDTATLKQTVRTYVRLFAAGDFPGARPLGIHLEGPYLNPEKKGAFNAAWLHPPTVAEVTALLEAGEGWIRQVTLAPELPNAPEVAATLRQAGVAVALGHSNTDYVTAAAALKGDFTHVTHTFNAQRGFHHREPGVLGAVLASDDVTAELIADTVHVHPGAMKVLLRCLGSARVVLITDAMAAAGLGDGRYELTGHEVWVKDGEARQANGTIAGSTATLDRCVRNMVEVVGLSLPEAVRMATLNPAMVLGLADRLGQIAEGYDANLVVLDPQGEVRMTLVQGRVVYDRDSRQEGRQERG
jgi:N-acetylglucosamine-6-phosphate deacetylase